MRTLTRSDRAREDIASALRHLRRHSAPAARRLAAAVDRACRLLRTNPLVGKARDDLEPGVRSVVVSGYYLMYTVTDTEVIVVRFLHGSRDLPASFTGDDT
jgi:toxin ParE1/3/4